MADLQKTVEIIFGGRNDLSQVIGSVERSLDGLENATQPFANVAVGIAKVETAVIASLSALATYSVNVAGTYQQGVNEVLTLMDGTAVNFQQFSSELQDYAADSTQSMDEVVSAAYQSISQGIPPETVTAFLATAEQLAVAGRSTLTESVNLLAGTANAYGLTIEEVSGLADTFFTAVQDGKTTIPELANAFGMVTSIGAPFKVSAEDIASGLAALTAYGAPSTNIAATNLKALIQGIVDPSNQAAKNFERLGIAFGADVFQTHTLADIIKEIGEKTHGSAGEIQGLFDNTEALKAALPLVKDEAGKFSDAVADMGQDTGIVAQKFAEMKDNFDLVLQQLKNSIKNNLIDIGKPLLDEFGLAVGGLDTVFDAIDLGIDSGALKPLTDFLADMLTAVGEYGQKIAAALPEAMGNLDLSAFIQSLQGLGTSIGDALSSILGEDIDLTTSAGVTTFLQVLVDALTKLNEVSSGMVSILPPVLDAIASFARTVSELDGETIVLIGQALGGLFVVNIAAGMATNVTSFAAALGNFGISLGSLSSISWASLSTNIAGFLAKAAPILGTAGAVAGAGAAGYGIGTLINNEINDAVSYFTSGDNDSLGGLVYDWIHGDEAAVATAVTSLVHPIKAIPTDISTVAEEAANIGWEIDKNGTLISSTEAMTNEVALKLAQLSSNETIVTIKADTEINIAEIEAQTERVKAALELKGLQVEATTARIEAMYDFNATAVVAEADKVKAAFEASADAIGTLGGELNTFGGLLDNTNLSVFDRMDIENFIQQELNQQQQLIDSQVRLADAQAALVELKYDKLNSGEALIRIESDGLEPALEQVLWSIMEKVQLKVAMEEAELLLALDAGV